MRSRSGLLSYLHSFSPFLKCFPGFMPSAPVTHPPSDHFALVPSGEKETRHRIHNLSYENAATMQPLPHFSVLSRCSLYLSHALAVADMLLLFWPLIGREGEQEMPVTIPCKSVKDLTKLNIFYSVKFLKAKILFKARKDKKIDIFKNSVKS